ncbi:MAG: hypothetical protein QQW96_22895 [Tychonema bourrellyi B0820]|uniref:hypothetical protein n=1 Tax=Tychonema bourrellyi TaxID=54313 RepID=UPI00117BEF74|nr:hypothetical protein [Tychonema bourrellyi]MDQ2100480.1 hypothetical protein [Tychonema bourrellyi B0820]
MLNAVWHCFSGRISEIIAIAFNLINCIRSYNFWLSGISSQMLQNSQPAFVEGASCVLDKSVRYLFDRNYKS